MADTYVQKIVAAMVTALQAAGGPAGLKVTASRKQPTASGSTLKHMAVYPLRDAETGEARPRNFPGARRLLTVQVMCRCAGTDQDNEALRAWALAQLMKDRTLGGVAVDLDEVETNWTGELDSAAEYSEAAMDFVVEYARPRATLEKV